MARSPAKPQRSTSLPAALTGERFAWDSPAGRLSGYRAAPPSSSLPPLLLVHSVNAAASAYEMRPLYERYRAVRPVIALDLPGFGFSERGDRPYSPRMMTDAVRAVLPEIARRHGDGPVDAVALSLGCEFLARAAAESPAAFRSLGLISPTGFNGSRPREAAPGTDRGMPALHAAFTFAPWRRAFFRLLTSPRSVRYFLRKTWGSPRIDRGVFAYALRTARQPGAEYAPFRFVSGYLFSGDISRVYESLRLPVWMVHGVRGDFVDYRLAERVAGRPNWHLQVFDTGALPHFEQPDAVMGSYERFVAALAPAAGRAA